MDKAAEPLSVDEFLAIHNNENILVQCEALSLALNELLQLACEVSNRLEPVLATKPTREQLDSPPDPSVSVPASLKYNHEQIAEISRILYNINEECQL